MGRQYEEKFINDMDEVAKKTVLNNGTAIANTNATASVTQSDVLINKFKQIFSNEQDAGSSATAQDQNSKSSTSPSSADPPLNSVKPSTESAGINLNKVTFISE